MCCTELCKSRLGGSLLASRSISSASEMQVNAINSIMDFIGDFKLVSTLPIYHRPSKKTGPNFP